MDLSFNRNYGANGAKLSPEAFEPWDELSKAMAGDPVVMYAHINWGLYPGVIYKYCLELGIDRVRAEINFLRKKTTIRNPGAYLRKRLQNMIDGDYSWAQDRAKQVVNAMMTPC